MMNKYHPALVLFLFLFCACGYFPGITTERPLHIKDGLVPERALSLLATIDNRNKDLKNFKGIGKLTLWEKTRMRVDERVAWVCSEPVNIRMVILAAGNPVVRMAGNGEWFYFQGYQNNRLEFNKIRTADPDLEKIIAVPLKISEIIRILSGRLPSKDYRWSTVEKRKSGSGYILTAAKWSGSYQKVYTGGGRDDIVKIEFYTFGNELTYVVEFSGMHDTGPYRIPETISIFKPAGKVFELHIDKYFTDIPVSPGMFELAPPAAPSSKTRK